MKTCRIPYENACRTRVRNLPNIEAYWQALKQQVSLDFESDTKVLLCSVTLDKGSSMKWHSWNVIDVCFRGNQVFADPEMWLVK